MLITAAAREHRRLIEAELNPGFRSVDSARLLADAQALALAVAESTGSLETKRDCLDLALAIRAYLRDTLSELRVSRADVEARFEELRNESPHWPAEIPPEAWDRLAAARLLCDITGVICGGGDYWEAIDIALEDEFGAHGRLPHIRTLYFAVDERDWAELRALRARLAESDANSLGTLLKRVEDRTGERFGMVVWSLQDVLDAVARARGIDLAFGDEATWEQAGIQPESVEELIDSVDSAITDRMTERGWEALEEAVAAFLAGED